MQQPSDPNVQAEENPKSLAQSWVGTILYCAFCFPFFLYSVFRIRDFMFIAITGFFALWGVVYLVLTIRMTLGQAKFGDLRLLMEHPAPSVGGRLTGSVSLPRAALQATTVAAKLTCYRLQPVDKGQRSEEPFWAKTLHVPILRKGGSGIARFAIDIPAEQQATRMPRTTAESAAPSGETYWKWGLQVTAEVPGLDLDRSFPIVVQPAASGAAAPKAEIVRPAAVVTPALVNPLRGASAFATALNPAARRSIAAIPGSASESPGAVADGLPADRSSTVVLVAVNLVPVAGVVLWHWQVGDIVILYWIENLVIGAFNVLRILFANPDQSAQKAKGIEATPGQLLAGKAAIASFFVIHYGAFCFGHGSFLASMFGAANQPDPGIGGAIAGLLRESGAMIAVLAIFASHAYSFFRNYLGRGEYRGANPGAMMLRPYGRIFVTHMFIIFGGFLLMATWSQVLPLILFIGLKIGIDAYMHRRERAALAPGKKP